MIIFHIILFLNILILVIIFRAKEFVIPHISITFILILVIIKYLITIKYYNHYTVAKAKAVFPTDDALFKSIYLAMMDITKKWTGTAWNWGQTLDQLMIYFGDRISPEDLE